MDKTPPEERPTTISENKEEANINTSLIGDALAPALTDLPDGIPMSVKGGRLQLNGKMFPEYRKDMDDTLQRGVEEGDETILQLYINNISQLPDKKEVEKTIAALKTAFETRSMEPLLHNLIVDGMSNDIAQRNLIRKGLEEELKRNPLKIIGNDDKEIPFDELDIVFSKDENSKKGGFKLIIGCKKGIKQVLLPDALETQRFLPDTTGLSKDKEIDAIIVPLKKAKDGTEPVATLLQIIRSPINLASVLAEQERSREEEDYRKSRATSTPKQSTSYHYVSS